MKRCAGADVEQHGAKGLGGGGQPLGPNATTRPDAGALSSNWMKPAAVKNHAPTKKAVLAPIVPSHIPSPGADPNANREAPMMNVHDCMCSVGRKASGVVAEEPTSS
ncbi:hypothetical protein [Candidatus Neomicrothrix sp.]|mgnify:FL=1|jgi:hypothetical protein|uniref:hypothetical protein n=1 Tax=Candidatus Neomicrothrix sp. TaxID=2719034 RepID=UPI000555E209|nr:hypothetical protein [Candidatus Microthrix sp.]MBP7595094.1 hypothetical protein [Candidatus Microthrix sp.]MBP7853842.1 hypothetical protein [Candidatus Microthrix sp.]MBP7879510.1 hypothetical protein [Candidatus Microthrix sp.]